MYPIPANATRIRYLESTGTQWIDTGYYASNKTDIELSFQPGTFNSTSGWRCLFGARMNNIGASSNRINTPMIWMQNTRQLAFNDYQSYDTGGTSAYAPANTPSVFEVRGRKLYLNGTQYAASGQTSTYQSTVTTGLLRCHFADGWEAATEASRQLPGKIYYMKFYEDGVLVRSFVPVRVGQTGYLFDKVSGELFGNAGTGSFVLGPDWTYNAGVIPTRMMAMGVKVPYDAEVEYIESTGTQYIDTVVKPDDTSVFSACGLFSYTASATRFGTRDSETVASFTFLSISSGFRASVGSGSVQNIHGIFTTGKNATSIKLDAPNRSGSAVFTDETTESKTCATSGTAFSCNHNFLLFAFNNGGTVVLATGARVSSCTITKGGVLIRDYIPVRVGTTGYLYDKVTKKLFGNAGTGSFVVGPDK